jgi:glyoxylase-like metal-dependent hydrolase (beta-lactamase superfamily II)
MHEIVDGIETWAWFSERHGYDFNGHYLRAARLAIDPVELTAEDLQGLITAGVDTIALTNRNHFRDAARLAAATGARVLVHPADAAFVTGKGVRVDGGLLPGERVGPFEILDASGKSPGEVALHWPERRLLLVGDICVGKPPGALALLPAAVMDDPAALRVSLARLATLDVDTLLVGDGASILSGAKAALAALVVSSR